MPYPYTQSLVGQEQFWTSGPQTVPDPVSEQIAGLAKFGMGVGALALLGRHKFSPDRRGWDYLIHAVRAIEEYSPGHIFRTFQISHMMSPLETPSLQKRFFSPELLSQLRRTESGRAWIDHLTRLVGQNMTSAEIMKYGFRYEGGQLLLGEREKRVLLRYANVIRSPTGASPTFQIAYARSLKGGPLFEKPPLVGLEYADYEARKASRTFTQRIKYINKVDEITDEVFMFTGGQTRLQAAKRALFGYGTALSERINQLARAPFELEPIATILKKVPFINRLRFGVVPSSGLRTFGKITAKLGILGYASYLAYQHLDYQVRQSKIFDDTILAEGITTGLATVWTRSQMALSEAADYLGLHTYREKQEQIAPGSTQISRLLAFPIMGAFGALGISYGQRLYRQIGFRRSGLSMGQASIAATAQDALWKQSIYGGVLPDDLLTSIEPTTLKLLEGQTQKQLSRWEGYLAKRIAEAQQKKGLGGGFLRLFGKISPTKLKMLIGGAVGTALIAPFLPGALIPSERPEELEDLYSGKKKVAIRKGRWWEFGRSPYEGQRIDRFREHWYPRMLARAKEKAIYGEEELSPFERWYKENFTYELEQRHYYERPYPITGTAFEDIPFIGPLLAGTIGRLIKPPRIMHEEEWMRSGESGEVEYLRMPLKHEEQILPGEKEPGAPISPYGAKGIIGEQIYRLTEMIGLPGFTMTSIKEAITGRADTFDQEMQLESARHMYGAEREYWDLELGGGLGTTELIRRLYPHRRRQIELYNPIRNQMPEWLPGPGERSPDFLHGDPYTKIPEGELRLPGRGYAALHPELIGVKPEDYPAIHKFSILADVAPYTDKYAQALADIRVARKQGKLTPEEEEMYQATLEQVKARKIRKEFTPYQYKPRKMTPVEEMLAMANQDEKQKSEPSWFERTVGRFWETITHNAETPFEYLTPISPAAKLIHARTAVEDYERTQVYGTQNAFWSHPIRDFFIPFFSSSRSLLGWEGIPKHVQEKRDLEEYFDILKYVKYTSLKRGAQAVNDEELAKEYENKRRETLFGINPYTYNFSHIFRSLPRNDRDYFNAFVEADLEERKQILQMIPDNEKSLFIARWKMKDVNDLQKAVKKGLLNEKQVQEAEKIVNQLYQEKDTEGFPKTKQLWEEYLTTRLPNESYADWYRRTQLLEEKLEGRPLPGPDWVGWHPAVDLDDIKLKIVQNEGRNTYDYDLWSDRVRAVARRPFIEEATKALEGYMSPNEVRNRVLSVLEAHNIRNAHIEVIPNGGGDIDLQLSEDRSKDVHDILRYD